MNQNKLQYIVLFILCVNFAYAGNDNLVKRLSNDENWNFIENKGQLSTSEIKYYGHQGSVYLFCKEGKISFVFSKCEIQNKDISEATGMITGISLSNACLGSSGRVWGFGQNKSISSKRTTSHTDLIILNSNLSCPIIASDKQEYYENYYTNGDADHGITNVHTYKTITYKEIYPHIDMVLRAIVGGLKYEFVVYPGGNVCDIQMQWNGVLNTQMINNGGIEYALAIGKMDEGKPVSFQGKKIIASSFEKKKNLIGFKLEEYDKSKLLVIDPTLIWGTYFGGSSPDCGNGIATDYLGNIYMTGYTLSESGIATTGAYQTSYYSNGDINDQGGFLSKFDNNGKILWSTYYGNETLDCYDVATDRLGNVYITGFFDGISSIATSGAYQTSKGYTFLSKFSGIGEIKWATYYGKAIDSGGFVLSYNVAVDDSENVYMTGVLIKTGYNLNGLPMANGDTSAFLTKFNGIGICEWSRTFGEHVIFGGNSVAADGAGNIYVTGTTADKSGIATVGAYQTSYGGGFHSFNLAYSQPNNTSQQIYGGGDVFLAKFNGGGKLIWATYFGGPGNENSGDVATDGYGNVYISGNTSSYSGIATKGAYQETTLGDDAYLAKFDGDGSLLWATYYGGEFFTAGYGLATDGSNNIYMTGATTCPSGIASVDGYQRRLTGDENAFLVEFNSSGARQWATYYGGSSVDAAYDVATDRFGGIYITGSAGSISGISTKGSHQISYGGGASDAFLAKFYNKLIVNDAGIDSFISPIGNYCKDTFPIEVQLKNYSHNELDSVKIMVSINGKTQPVYSWTGKLRADSIVKVVIKNAVFNIGIDTIKAWTYSPNGGLDSFPGNDTSMIVINNYPLPSANAGPDTTLCYNEIYTMQGSGGITYTWHPATYLSSATDPNANAKLPNTEGYELVVTNLHGCVDSGYVLLKVRPKLFVKITGDTQVCQYGKIALTAKANGGDSLNYLYTWQDDDNALGDILNSNALKSGWHKVILRDNCSPDPATDSFYVSVIPATKAAFTWLPDSSPAKRPVQFNNLSLNAKKHQWDFDNKDSDNIFSPVYIFEENGTYTVRLIAYGLYNCPNDTAYNVIYIISHQITIYIPNAFSPNGDGINDFFDITGDGIKSYSFNIYNRWGELIYASPQPSPTGEGARWDGKSNSKDVPEGVYLYTLDVIDVDGIHHYLSGNVTLMR